MQEEAGVDEERMERRERLTLSGESRRRAADTRLGRKQHKRAELFMAGWQGVTGRRMSMLGKFFRSDVCFFFWNQSRSGRLDWSAIMLQCGTDSII